MIRCTQFLYSTHGRDNQVSATYPFSKFIQTKYKRFSPQRKTFLYFYVTQSKLIHTNNIKPLSSLHLIQIQFITSPHIIHSLQQFHHIKLLLSIPNPLINKHGWLPLLYFNAYCMRRNTIPIRVSSPASQLLLLHFTYSV